MKFEEALAEARKGKKIKAKEWPGEWETNAKTIDLINKWLGDKTNYDEVVYPTVKDSISENPISFQIIG